MVESLSQAQRVAQALVAARHGNYSLPSIDAWCQGAAFGARCVSALYVESCSLQNLAAAEVVWCNGMVQLCRASN